MSFSPGENCRPPSGHPNKDRHCPSPSSLPHSLNHRKPPEPSCAGSAAESGEPTRLALKRLFYEYKVSKAATAEGRTNLRTVENRGMTNCAAAAVWSWPGAASQAPPGEGCLLRSYFAFILFRFCFHLKWLSPASFSSLTGYLLMETQKCTAVRLQWAFSSALWRARPFQVTFVNRAVCVLAGSSLARARAAMPFGCLTLGEKKDYNSPSEVTDKYDLGQVVKSWVHPHWNASVWLNKGIKTRSSFLWQRGILWDIPGQRQEHPENVHL